MEDSVGEEERREQGETMAQPKAHQEELVAAAGGVGGSEPAQDGGFLSAMASKIGATMSGANGSAGEANAAAASDGEALERDGDGEPGEEGGGFLSAMASKIGAAMSGANGGSESDGGGTAAAVAPDDDGKEKGEGDGGGGIFHKLLSGSPPASSPGSGALEAEGAKGEEKDQGVADEHAGILCTMASKIGMAMSGANGNGNRGTEDGTKTSNGRAVDGSNGEEKGGDANGGGILNAMASKIGMAMSGANGDEDHGGCGAKTGNGNAVDGSKDEEKRDEANGGGILSTVASKIGMPVSGANGNGNHSTEDGAKTSNGDAVHGSKGEEEKGHDANGAGIVEQIISNLPSDDQAPDSDEASLLIAIIED